jgi:serine/threonine protein kinase/formylglycine-generating enzyme required for sulfatase activity
MAESLPADRTEDLIAECLERIDTEGEAVIDVVCAHDPEAAERVRAGLARLGRLGLSVAEPNLIARNAIPERLGDFRLLRRIGSGGMGVVYLAEQQSLQRQVALKLIRPEFLYFPGARDRFEREIKAVLQLQHPSILPIYTVGESNGIPYFAMEWVDGATVDQVLHQLGGNAPERLTAADLASVVGSCPVHRPGSSWVTTVFELLHRVADALHHAHERGVVHRDVKPSNILLARDGRVLLVDFGLALTPESSRLTRTGSQMGSLPYMSPEQVRGDPSRIDRRTDVYSLGVVAFELLTLKTPYLSDTADVTRKQILEGKATTIRHWNRSVPPDAEAVCLKAMDVDVERRYHTADAFAKDMARVLAHRHVIARRPGPWLRTRRFVQRRPTLSLGIAMGALLFVAALAFAWRERKLAEAFRQLGDRPLLDYLNATADTFWPAQPAKLPEMDLWLTQAGELSQRLEVHRAALEELRASAEPYDVVARARDQAEPRAHLEALHRERKGTESFLSTTDLSNANRELAMIDDQIRAEERRLDERRTWVFSDRVDQLRHDALAQLVNGLVAFRTRIEDVKQQREVALMLEREAIQSQFAEHWREAIEDIEALPVYRGLHLTPQLGLSPWRRNPQSGLWEFRHFITGEEPIAEPRPGDPGHVKIEPGTGIVLVLLPGGTFLMGSGEKEEDPDASPSERPRHEVELAPFFLSKYELTFDQWSRLAAALRPETTKSLPTEPAQVTWRDASKALQQVGLQIPTEAQWEYACRAGTTSVYFTGDTVTSLEGHANLYDESVIGWPTADGTPNNPKDWVHFNDHNPERSLVGTFLPNAFGLYDMIGNVSEWCQDQDVWRAYHTMPARPGDGLRELIRPTEKRCVRGGSWNSLGPAARSAARGAAFEGEGTNIGVRPARAIDP